MERFVDLLVAPFPLVALITMSHPGATLTFQTGGAGGGSQPQTTRGSCRHLQGVYGISKAVGTNHNEGVERSRMWKCRHAVHTVQTYIRWQMP